MTTSGKLQDVQENSLERIGRCVCTALVFFMAAPVSATPAHSADPDPHSSAITQRSTAGAARAREDVLGCLLMPMTQVEVGSPVIGVLTEIPVERGDHVKRGQPIAQLDAQLERASLDAATQRAKSSGDYSATKTAAQHAKRMADRAEELFNQHFISATDRDKALAEAKIAAMHLQQAQEQREVARREVAVAQAQLDLRTILSPIDGVVADRYMSPGERVENKPVLKLAQIDPLRVEVVVASRRFSDIKPGLEATVTPELAGLAGVSARVTTVDAVIDAASNTFRVRLELPNPGNAIPSGLRCRIDFKR